MPSLFDRLKIPVLTVLISLLLFFLLIKLFGPIPFAVNSVTTQKTDLFTVDGVGETTGVPDTAQISVGVQKTAITVEDAQNQTNEAVNAITQELKKLGIDEKDIKTTSYNVNPNIDYTTATQRTTGYSVNVQMDVKIKEASKANQALDTATKNGANIISGVSFVLNDDEREKLEAEARNQAIKNAKAKAQEISSQVGLRLGRVINVSVSPVGNAPMPYERMALDSEQGNGGAASNLQPGENTIRVNVSISYETL